MTHENEATNLFNSQFNPQKNIKQSRFEANSNSGFGQKFIRKETFKERVNRI